VLIASNSFKECATSFEVNNYIEQGILLYEKLFADKGTSLYIEKVEICDGGTGFASILSKAMGGFLQYADFKDPLMRDISTFYGVSSTKNEVFIEVATTAGLALLKKNEQNPINTTSFGVGLQVVDAINRYKPKIIYVGCGDTSINDFGLGFLCAVGVKFYDIMGNKIFPIKPLDFLNVTNISIENSDIINYLTKECKMIVCCNLSSIIGGKASTTNIYAKQKGASNEDVENLNLVKEKFISMCNSLYDIDISDIPGGGSAGGLGAALLTFCNAKLTYSFEKIFEILNLSDKIQDKDLIITGEGLIDANSLKGKAPIALALYSKRYNKKVAIIAGAVTTNSTNILTRGGVDYVETLTCEYFNLHEYISRTKTLVRDASFRLFKKILIK
jgi:glycerate kinase